MVITLVVVMGIAWIGNVLFFDVNLIFVAYIMTIFIVCQGIIILGRHGSDSLCRDERENKMAATYNVLAFKR